MSSQSAQSPQREVKKAVILLGGKGTRLSALFPDLPKALVPVASRPFLAWQLEWLFAGNISSILLAAGYMGDKIQKWVRQQSFNERVSVSIEPEPLGTGGALKYLTETMGNNLFFALNGDSLLPELNFQKMAEAHRKSSALATVAVTTIEDSGRYGTVIFDKGGKIVKFDEKKSRSRFARDKTSGWVNGGVYLLNSSILSSVQANKTVSLEYDIFPQLATDGKLSAFQCPPPLLDMGTPEGLEKTENYLALARKTR